MDMSRQRTAFGSESYFERAYWFWRNFKRDGFTWRKCAIVVGTVDLIVSVVGGTVMGVIATTAPNEPRIAITFNAVTNVICIMTLLNIIDADDAPHSGDPPKIGCCTFMILANLLMFNAVVIYFYARGAAVATLLPIDAVVVGLCYLIFREWLHDGEGADVAGSSVAYWRMDEEEEEEEAELE